MALPGDAPALFVLRTGANDAQPKPFDLHYYGANSRINALSRALSLQALRLLYAHAQRIGLAQYQLRQSITFLNGTHEREHDGGTILLHLDRGKTDIQRARAKQLLHQVAQQFSTHVIDIALYDRDPIGIGLFLCICTEESCRAPQAEAETVRPGKRFLPKTAADAFNGNRRRFKARQSCQYRSARWCHHFTFSQTRFPGRSHTAENF